MIDETRIVIVDDHGLIHDAIPLAISIPNAIFLGRITSSYNLVERIKEKKPDIILLDVQISGMSFLEVTTGLKNVAPVIALTGHKKSFQLAVAIYQKLVMGVLLKGEELRKDNYLTKTINTVLAGGTFFTPKLDYINKICQPNLPEFTAYQIQIMIMMVDFGLDDNQIMQELGTTKNAVERVRSNIRERLPEGLSLLNTHTLLYREG